MTCGRRCRGGPMDTSAASGGFPLAGSGDACEQSSMRPLCPHTQLRGTKSHQNKRGLDRGRKGAPGSGWSRLRRAPPRARWLARCPGWCPRLRRARTAASADAPWRRATGESPSGRKHRPSRGPRWRATNSGMLRARATRRTTRGRLAAGARPCRTSLLAHGGADDRHRGARDAREVSVKVRGHRHHEHPFDIGPGLAHRPHRLRPRGRGGRAGLDRLLQLVIVDPDGHREIDQGTTLDGASTRSGEIAPCSRFRLNWGC